MEYLTSAPYYMYSQLSWALGALTGYGRPGFVPKHLCDFDVDSETGFVPPRPLPRMQGDHKIWEDTLRDAAGKIGLGNDESEEGLARRAYGKSWRKSYAQWPILDTSSFTLKEQQRAHYVLAYSHPQVPRSTPRCCFSRAPHRPRIDIRRHHHLEP